MFLPGDLIRVPSNVELIKINNMNFPSHFRITTKPKMAIFVKYRDEGECVINADGENWIAPIQSIRIMENESDKINTNN